MNPFRYRFLFLIAFLICHSCTAAPKSENRDWEDACGGSNIEIIKDNGVIISIDAYVEHFSEGRQWICHFTDGKIVSAVFKHFIVTRTSSGDAGQFSIKTSNDLIKAFHFPDHRLTDLNAELKSDLEGVLDIATKG